MALRASLMVLILLFLASSAGWSSTILLYALSTRRDSDGWYTGPRNAAALVKPVERDGHSVTVEDKNTLKELTLTVLLKYDQAWILEGDADDIVEVSADEAAALYKYYQQGYVVWISTEQYNWAEDTKVFMDRFGVDVEGLLQGPAAPPVKGNDPILSGVKTLRFDDWPGGLIINNPDVKVIWQYPSRAGKKDAIAVLDKKGYAVFDSGWVLGYGYRPEARNDSNIQFALNIAKIKPRLAVSPGAGLTTAWGGIKTNRQ